MSNKTLAIFSPAASAYSETFIEAHKSLPFTIKFYYDGMPPTKLEGIADIMTLGFFDKLRKRKFINYNDAEFALLNSLKKEKVDFVLAEYGTTAAVTVKIVKQLHIPMLVHFHGFDASRKDIVADYAAGYRDVFKYASMVVAVSNKMKADLMNMGCAEEKLLVTPCGPHASFFEVVPLYNSLQFVAVGRFVEKKAPQLTITAFKKVTEKYPHATLVMIGAGVLMEDCSKLVTALNLQRSVRFAGVLSREAIQAIMKQSIAFVQHSVVAGDGDTEGTPVAVLEAQAAGLPVIATEHAGIPDVVINNETGLLTAEHDFEGMANNMLRILSTPGLAKQLGSAGKKRVKENFTLERHLQLLTDAIEGAMK